jgi:transposase
LGLSHRRVFFSLCPFKPAFEVGNTLVYSVIYVRPEVSAAKAYSTVKNLEAIAEWGADPFVPFKSNTTGNGGGNSLWRRLWGYYQFQREEFLPHYHKRSNVETTFSMIKAKFGGKLWSKSETGQVNEALLKVICHNIVVLVQSIYELGIEPVFWPTRVAAARAN